MFWPPLNTERNRYMDTPLPQTWWVEPGRLLAGGFPGDMDPNRARKRLQRLLQAGVRCFISLQEIGEMSWTGCREDYAPLLEGLIGADSGSGITCHAFPIPDMGIAERAIIREILHTINEALSEGRGVYVHCWGGHGRTGMVVGCWLREQGLSGLDALERLNELRADDEVLQEWNCPQTPEQMTTILKWQPGNGNGEDEG